VAAQKALKHRGEGRTGRDETHAAASSDDFADGSRPRARLPIDNRLQFGL
jgi:hypothetical protein